MHRNTENFESVLLVLPVGLVELGHLCDTGAAPRAPEVDQQHLAFEVFLGVDVRRVLKGRKFEGGKRIADSDGTIGSVLSSSPGIDGLIVLGGKAIVISLQRRGAPKLVGNRDRFVEEIRPARQDSSAGKRQPVGM